MMHRQFFRGTTIVHGSFYSERKALRVISLGKQRLTVYRAHEVVLQLGCQKMTRRAFLALRVIQRQGKWLVETENSDAPSYSNLLKHNGGANRAEHTWRIFPKGRGKTTGRYSFYYYYKVNGGAVIEYGFCCMSRRCMSFNSHG